MRSELCLLFFVNSGWENLLPIHKIVRYCNIHMVAGADKGMDFESRLAGFNDGVRTRLS